MMRALALVLLALPEAAGLELDEVVRRYDVDGVMIARAALFRLERGERSGPGLNAYATQELPGLMPPGAVTA